MRPSIQYKLFGDSILKKTASLLILATILSCGDNKSSSSSPLGGKTDGVLQAGELLTKYSEQSVVECSLRDIENNQLDYSIQNNSYDNHFDIQITSVLSRKITADLQQKGLDQKITPKTFWSVLDSNLRKELNEVIVESDIKRNYAEFVRLQKEVAFAYTVYIENPTYNDGYRLQSIVNETKRSTLIAFTEYTKAVRNISPCDENDIGDVAEDSTLLKPSDITARISCQNRSGESLLMDEYRSKSLFLSLKANEIIEDFILGTKDLQILKDAKRTRELVYTKDFNYELISFDIDKVHSSKPNSIDRLDLEILPAGSDSIKIKKLNCITIKELIL